MTRRPSSAAWYAAYWTRVAAQAPGLPIYITENGCGADDYINPEGEINDYERVAYVHGHLLEALRAIDDGVDLRGYFHWSLADNYEWGSYEPRFGLFGMDRSDPSGRARWMETDAAGHDAAAAFTAAVRQLSSTR